MTNEKCLYHGRGVKRGFENLIVAVGERAIKDFERALKTYQKQAGKRNSLKRSAALFRANHRMEESAQFFLDDPYDIFPNGGGKQIVALLKKKHNFIPVAIPTKEEYREIMKSIEK